MYTIRQATLEDAELISQQRRGMFLDLGFADDETMKRKIAQFVPWLKGKMSANEYLGWLADADHRIGRPPASQ